MINTNLFYIGTEGRLKGWRRSKKRVFYAFLVAAAGVSVCLETTSVFHLMYDGE